MKRTPYAATATAATALAGALIAGTASANTAAGPEAAAPRPGRWDFAVTLDDKPIGRHRFELAGDPATGEWTLKSQAEYDVKILGLTVYTYRHSATERWRAGCLAQALSSSTASSKKYLAVLIGCAYRNAAGLFPSAIRSGASPRAEA